MSDEDASILVFCIAGASDWIPPLRFRRHDATPDVASRFVLFAIFVLFQRYPTIVTPLNLDSDTTATTAPTSKRLTAQH